MSGIYDQSVEGAEDLMLLAHVAARGGFTAAAKATGIPQSTISRRIASLEARLGVRLLQRSTRNVTLTAPGERMRQHGQRLIDSYRAANAELTGFKVEPSGLLRVTAPVALGQAFLGPLLAEFCFAHPKVILAVDVTNRNVDLIEEGFDVALRVGSLAATSMIARSIGRGRSRLFAAPSYLRSHGLPTTPSELTRHRILHNGPLEGAVRWKLQGPHEKALTLSPPAIVRATDASLLLDMARAGVGIARLPSFVASAAVEHGELVGVLPTWSSDTVEVHAVFPSHKGMAPAVRAFIDLAVARLPRQLA